VSILNSLYIGASGMNAHGGAISVVGDNIANVSTIGYKRSRADFADVLGGNLGATRLGAGVRLGGASQIMGQGAIQQTGGALDLAIRGEGMFVVKGDHAGQAGTYYSRDGRFGLDNQGFVVDARGLRLQGYTIDASGAVGTSAGDLELAGADSPPVATAAANLSMNLDPSETAIPAATVFDPADPTSFNHQTSATVYDSLGNAHEVQMYFRKNADNAWEWHAMVDGGEVTGGAAGTPTEIATGTLTFDGTGALAADTMTSSSVSFTGATANQAIAFDFGASIADGGTGLGATTQYAGAFDTNGLDIDGRSAGKLLDVQVDDDGTVRGVYDNGDTRDIARVALATFGAEAELTRAGDGLYAESSASGQALVGAVGTGGRGSLSAGALEGSNVDLGAELVTMIAYQRAFQANVKTVTTADEMLAEVASIKR
jgi:flagellar hook protein FlgE